MPKDAPIQPLFSARGDGFVAADMTRGPWDERMMHGGAPSALLAREVSALSPGEDLVVTRLTIDFLSGVPLGRVDVQARVVRPGRRFQVVDATLSAGGGRDVCLARAVRVRRADLPSAAVGPASTDVPLPPPEDGVPLSLLVSEGGERFYPHACEIRHVAASSAPARSPHGSACADPWWPGSRRRRWHASRPTPTSPTA